MRSISVVAEGRRKRLRLRYLAAAKITTAKGKILHGNLRDIGIDSLYIKIDKELEKAFDVYVEESVDVALIVMQGVSRLTIETEGKITRKDIDGVAISFTDPLKWWPIFSFFPVNEHFLFDVVTKT